MRRASRGSRLRVRLAWVLLVASLAGWPVSAFTFARGEPVTVLGLSWVAIAVAALDVLLTAQVQEKQNGGSSRVGGMDADWVGQMHKSRYENPPDRWAAAVDAGGDVFYRVDLDAEDVLGSALVWHWCPVLGRWRAAHVGQHELVKADPLHLEPSLLWGCCEKHGFLRGGRWADA